jgi:predicted TIM-barrel fold metal-dependent hydrolase
MSTPVPGSEDWLDLGREATLDPARPIIDPHHHLWLAGTPGAPWPAGRPAYLLRDLWGDTGSGHNIVKSVFIECRAAARTDGPDHLKPVGETEFVVPIARASRDGNGAAEIAGIVAHADLRGGARLDEALDAHAQAAGTLFKGIRHSGARDPHPEALKIPGRGTEGLYADPAFRAGVARLGERGLTYDSWHYHHQNPDFAALARAVPGTTMVIDHFGTPLGVGPYAGQRDAIFRQWQRDVADIARCPNVVAKLGGMAMPDNGFGWDQRDRPASSDELVEAQAAWYHHMIDCFGPERCMFESNFPVDRRSLPYGTYWNAMKKIAARYSPAAQQALFHDTAARVYRL